MATSVATTLSAVSVIPRVSAACSRGIFVSALQHQYPALLLPFFVLRSPSRLSVPPPPFHSPPAPFRPSDPAQNPILVTPTAMGSLDIWNPERESNNALAKQYDKSEEDLKALQSVGQVGFARRGEWKSGLFLQQQAPRICRPLFSILLWCRATTATSWLTLPSMFPPLDDWRSLAPAIRGKMYVLP